MSKKASTKVPVTSRALLQRINRALAPKDERVKTTRGERWRHELGDYYTIDVSRNTVIGKHVDLEKWGRELGVLKPYEIVRDNGH